MTFETLGQLQSPAREAPSYRPDAAAVTRAVTPSYAARKSGAVNVTVSLAYVIPELL
jgi:hypothetical protein